MNRLIYAVLISAGISLFVAGCAGYGIDSDKTQIVNAEKVQGKNKDIISTWGWYEDSFKACFSEFEKVYPGVALEYTSVSPVNGEYMQKVQSTIASGNRLPDILWGERSLGLRGQLFDYDIWEDLGKPPYNVDLNNFFDYTAQLITDSKGRICGLDWELDAAGLAYKRDMAKKYLGTDDPDKLESMLGTWEEFIETGKKVFKESSGKVTMLSGLRDAYTILIDQKSESIAVNDTISTGGVLKDTFAMLSRLRNSNNLGSYETWTPSWRMSFAGDNVIFYPCATWSVDLVIKPNDKNGSGNWGLMVPPGGGFSTGGTTFGITKDSGHKEVSWKFLNWFLNSEDGARVNREMGNHFIPLKSIYNNPDITNQKSSFFADQDLGNVWFKKITPGLTVRSISKYDQIIVDTSTVVMRAMAMDRQMDGNSALKMWREIAKANHPGIDVR
jgi:multiple sugar transport system substrate-binding protein